MNIFQEIYIVLREKLQKNKSKEELIKDGVTYDNVQNVAERIFNKHRKSSTFLRNHHAAWIKHLRTQFEFVPDESIFIGKQIVEERGDSVKGQYNVHDFVRLTNQIGGAKFCDRYYEIQDVGARFKRNDIYEVTSLYTSGNCGIIHDIIIITSLDENYKNEELWVFSNQLEIVPDDNEIIKHVLKMRKLEKLAYLNRSLEKGIEYVDDIKEQIKKLK